MVQQTVQLAKSGIKLICVVSDDTEVFILLVHFYDQKHLSCKLVMGSIKKRACAGRYRGNCEGRHTHMWSRICLLCTVFQDVTL